MGYRYLKICQKNPSIAHITLNRPEKCNALNLELMHELCEVLEVLKTDPELRIIVFFGAGKIFCAGLDLLESVQSQNVKELALAISELFIAIYLSPLVTIAALEGDAIAGGAGIVAACDFVIAAEEVRIGFPEVHKGVVAALVSTLLYRQICLRDVRELLLTGELISAKRACEMHLVTQVVTREDISKAIDTLTDKILKGSPNALKETKNLLHKLAPNDFQHDIKIALSIYDLISISKDAKEGMTAFLEKRKPSWNQTKE